jgi:hypothetical protein
MDLDETLYGLDAIKDSLESILLNPVDSAVPKWRTFKFLRRVQRNPLITFELNGGFG